MIKKTLKLIQLFLIFLLFVFPASHGAADDAAFEVHLLDVGQGLSVLVKVDEHFLLYDGGGRESSSYVVSYLKKQGVEKLDYVVASHYDEDHISGLIGAMHVFECGQILEPDYETDTDIFRSYREISESCGAEISHPVQGQVFEIGDGGEMMVVGPADYDSDVDNDRSVAVRISYGDVSVLLGGDAEWSEENEIVSYGGELASTFYVVNHHGSSSSSSGDFLDAVQPQYAMISCKSGNSYGHPTEEVMERLKAHGCHVFRTDLQGCVVIYSDGESVWMSASPCDDFSAGVRPEAEGDGGLTDAGGLAADAGGLAADAGGLAAGAGGLTDAPALAAGAAGLAGAGSADETDNSAAQESSYVCNANTKKFHYPYCPSVKQMKEKNRIYTNQSRDELIAEGYDPCKNCNP